MKEPIYENQTINDDECFADVLCLVKKELANANLNYQLAFASPKAARSDSVIFMWKSEIIRWNQVKGFLEHVAVLLENEKKEKPG